MESSSELIAQVRRGQRESLAAFVARHEGLIRARFREQFASAPTDLFDSSDFFVTILRRFDTAIGSDQTSSADVLTQVLARIMSGAASDYLRVLQAEQRLGGAGWPRLVETTEARAGADLPSLSTLDETDNQILRLRAQGSQHEVVADALGMSAAAVRMRWHRICTRLRKLARTEGA